MDKIMTGCFFGNNNCNIYNLETRTRWTIESLVLEKNLRKFYFGSGGEFEKLCYDIVKSCQKKFPPITCEVFICKDWEAIKKVIDKSDYCIFEEFCNSPSKYICEGVDIYPMPDKLNFAYEYAKEKNIKIFRI